MTIQPTLIIHGGAGKSIKDAQRAERIREKMSVIVSAAYETLLKSGALEAVVHAVRLLEDDPEFNAGTGSRIQSDGEARLSASIMDGKNGKFAGVLNIERIKNPILVARALLEKEDRVLSDQGAFDFAQKIGFKSEDPRTPEAIERWKKSDKKGSDTVGACALDTKGYLASATSTGGKGMETPGRVSDSGMPVANFANDKCAISATGTGEEIIEEGLAIKIATRVIDSMSLKKAFQKSFKEVRAHKRNMGAIGLNNRGQMAWDTSTENLCYAWKKGDKAGIF